MSRGRSENSSSGKIGSLSQDGLACSEALRTLWRVLSPGSNVQRHPKFGSPKPGCPKSQPHSRVAVRSDRVACLSLQQGCGWAVGRRLSARTVLSNQPSIDVAKVDHERDRQSPEIEPAHILEREQVPEAMQR